MFAGVTLPCLAYDGSDPYSDVLTIVAQLKFTPDSQV